MHNLNAVTSKVCHQINNVTYQANLLISPHTSSYNLLSFYRRGLFWAKRVVVITTHAVTNSNVWFYILKYSSTSSTHNRSITLKCSCSRYSRTFSHIPLFP